MSPGLRLYVRKVLISDEFDLMPRYLSFIKGVVDSDDLPLNVNRETLQESKIIKIIKKKLVRKAIELIRKMSNAPMPEDEPEEAELDEEGNIIEKDESDKPKKIHPYITWYKKFGLSLKMGCIDDSANKDKLQKLLRFKSSKADGENDYISLQEYVDRMKDWQKEIYVFPGESVKTLKESSFMDAFLDQDVEVIYLTDAIDEYFIGNVREFGGKKFRDITKEGVKFSDEDEDMAKRRAKVYSEKLKPLTKFLKKLYGSDVSRVSISKRLGRAPAIVSSSEWGNSANMDRIMRAQAFAHGVRAGGERDPHRNPGDQPPPSLHHQAPGIDPRGRGRGSRRLGEGRGVDPPRHGHHERGLPHPRSQEVRRADDAGAEGLPRRRVAGIGRGNRAAGRGGQAGGARIRDARWHGRLRDA